MNMHNPFQWTDEAVARMKTMVLDVSPVQSSLVSLAQPEAPFLARCSG